MICLGSSHLPRSTPTTRLEDDLPFATLPMAPAGATEIAGVTGAPPLE
jgi:hypothetical protein